MQGAAVGENANNLEGCYDLSNPIRVVRTETIAYTLVGGATFCVEGSSDFLTDDTISVTGNIAGANSTFVVTDEQGNILGLPPTLTAVQGIDFDEAGPGTCLVWHLSFEDGLQGATLGGNANNLEGTYDLSNPVSVVRNPGSMANAGDDVTICNGEEVMLTATGGVSYMWSTGETTASIKVAPMSTTTYTVKVTSDAGCESSDEVVVNVNDKVTIGNFVWLDENRNGLQDDGATGINDVMVTLHQCDGTVVASTTTANDANGEAGAYSFDVCPNSGEYYVVFGNTPEGTEFTDANAGADIEDSDANANGRTDCFEVTDVDNMTIDGGLVEICNIKVDAGNEVSLCLGDTIELSAEILDHTADCPGICVYPIKEQDRCFGPEGNFEIWLISNGSNFDNFKFKASEQHFERNANNELSYTATATNGLDVIRMNVAMVGYTTSAPFGSPKLNDCQEYDTSDYEYWTAWEGTIVSENHGTFDVSIRGEAFQMGEGADVTRTGFGASGWFQVDGGDGFYSIGDVNLTLDPCIENGINFQWSTEDGNIIGNSNQKTIEVDAYGTYTVEAVNCLDCVATDTIVVTKGICASSGREATPRIMEVYPVPVQSGGRVTIEFDTADASALSLVELQAGTPSISKESVSLRVYDMTGRIVDVTSQYEIVNGKAVIYLDLNYVTSGRYIVRASGSNWSDSKSIIVR